MFAAKVRLTALTKAVKAGGKRRFFGQLDGFGHRRAGRYAIQEKELIGRQTQEIKYQRVQLANRLIGSLADDNNPNGPASARRPWSTPGAGPGRGGRGWGPARVWAMRSSRKGPAGPPGTFWRCQVPMISRAKTSGVGSGGSLRHDGSWGAQGMGLMLFGSEQGRENRILRYSL